MTYVEFFVVIVICEVVLNTLFALLARVYYKWQGFDMASIFKGWVERLFLCVALLSNYPHALALFGALKVATRLKHEEEPGKAAAFNNYYLIGNFISVMAAMGYVYIYNTYLRA